MSTCETANTLALLNLHLQDGRHILIDAGSEYTVGDFDLRKLKTADEIIIRGQQKTIEGKPVLVVESIGAQSAGENSSQDQIYRGGHPGIFRTIFACCGADEMLASALDVAPYPVGRPP